MRAVLEPARRLAVLAALAVLAGCGGGDTARSVDCRGRAEPPALTTASFGADDRPAILARAGPGGGVHDLVVAFHGRTNDHAQVRGYFDLEAHARRPTVVVYPSALPVAHPPRAWHDPGDHGGALRDFALFDAIVRETTRRYCVDPERVFVVGHSLGASFANALACTRGRTVRAAASVAGGIATARCEGAAAALLVHHPADRLVPIEVGRRARDTLLTHRGLEGAPPTSVDFAGLACRRWGDAGTAPVLWCRHDETSTRAGRYYPHRWPSTAGTAFMRFFDERP